MRFWNSYTGSGWRAASCSRPLVGTNEVVTMLEVGEGFPCGVMEWVTLPFHEVLDLGTSMTLVEDGFHFVLGLTVDDERGRMSMGTARGVEGARVDVRE